MTAGENGPAVPVGGLDRVLGDDTANVTELLRLWGITSALTLGVGYELYPTLEEYIQKYRPRLAHRMAEPKHLGRMARSRLRDATAEHQTEVARVEAQNSGLYEIWLDRASDICIEAGGLAILAGDDELAESYLTSPIVPAGAASRSDLIALALLARGDEARAKPVLLRHEGGISGSHINNLMAAYWQSGDDDYRRALLHSIGDRPLLTARIFRRDLSLGNNSFYELLAAANNEYAHAALSGMMIAHDPGVVESDEARRFLDSVIGRLAPPAKKTQGPVDRITGRAREDSIFDIFGVVEEIFDTVTGGDFGTEPTPAYIRWRNHAADVLAVLGPYLRNIEGYDAIAGEVGSFAGKRTILLKNVALRSELGDKSASTSILANSSAATSKHAGPAYRHVLRDDGPTVAMNYLWNLDPGIKRVEIYHTIVAFAMQGVSIRGLVDFPDLTDRYGPLQNLYKQAADMVIDAGSDAGRVMEASAQLAGAEALVADIGSLEFVNVAGLQDLITRIRALNDPEIEARLLQALVKKESED